MFSCRVTTVKHGVAEEAGVVSPPAAFMPPAPVAVAKPAENDVGSSRGLNHDFGRRDSTIVRISRSALVHERYG